MTNYVAFWLIAIIITVIAADYFYFEWNLMQIFLDATTAAIRWLAFWR
ncbi:MAG: glyceraldehyde-3-phosphate dehydrogenase [Paracoccaceae bacterium]